MTAYGRTIRLAFVCMACAQCGSAWPQNVTGSGAALLPAIPADCGVLSRSGIELAPLPNATKAIKERKRLRLLAIGGPSVSGLDAESAGDQQRLQDQLGRLAPGLRIELVNRGVSGELVADAAERIKNEVALNDPDIVLWQVGTADALARIQVAEFEAELKAAIIWLKQRNVDVILAGARYARQAVEDADYQAIRQTVFRVARDENVPRISQWKVAEAVEKARNEELSATDQYELTEESSFCVAQYIAKILATSLF